MCKRQGEERLKEEKATISMQGMAEKGLMRSAGIWTSTATTERSAVADVNGISFPKNAPCVC